MKTPENTRKLLWFHERFLIAQGYESYKRNAPYALDAPKAWKMGWHKASCEAWRGFYFEESPKPVERRLTI